MANYPEIFDEIGYALRERAERHLSLAFRFDSAVRAVRLAETLEEERAALNHLAAVHMEVIAVQGAELERVSRNHMRTVAGATREGTKSFIAVTRRAQ